MLQGKKAYICSPLSAPNPEGMQHNMELAKYYLMPVSYTHLTLPTIMLWGVCEVGGSG